jgi:pimeloyl-ACP methyl ester carboxylesterase
MRVIPNTQHDVSEVSLYGQTLPVYGWGTTGTRGEVGASDVVLVHGYMDAALTWDLVAPVLAGASRRVWAFDQRGYGQGHRVAAGDYYHFPDYVRDLANVLDALAIERCVLVGHSMGGVVTTLFAGAFPERVSHLALIEGAGPPDHRPGDGPARMRAFVQGARDSLTKQAVAPPTSFTLEHALSRLALNHPGVAPDVLATRAPRLVREVEPGRYVWAFDPLHRTRSPMPFFASLYREYAHAVTAPVLWVSGGVSGFHPEDEAARLAAFARLDQITLDDAGHMVHWTQPTRLAQALLTWLDGTR